MTTKIGLIGDPHAAPEPLAEALAILREEKVDEVLCTGDIAGYGGHLEKTVSLLKESGCRSIYGNHELWHLDKAGHKALSPADDYIRNLPPVIEGEREGKSFYMVHASPPLSTTKGIRLLDEHGNVIEAHKQAWSEQLKNVSYDILIIGHTHQVFAEEMGDTLVINAGSTRFNHCCAVLSLPEVTIKWFALSGQKIDYTWNWGEEFSK